VEAYCWDVSKPVEIEEISSMEKLDDALSITSSPSSSTGMSAVAHVAKPACITSLHSPVIHMLIVFIVVESR
jgi:hypothetical protein